jgi:hypothetical protein
MAGPVPAIPIVWSDALFSIGITGTGPVMTRGETRRDFQETLSPKAAGTDAVD